MKKGIAIVVLCIALALSAFASSAAALNGEDMGSFVLVDQRKNPGDPGDNMDVDQAAFIVEHMLFDRYADYIDDDQYLYVLVKGIKKISGSEGYLFSVGQGDTKDFDTYFQAIVTYDGGVYQKDIYDRTFAYCGQFMPGSSDNVVLVDERKTKSDPGDNITPDDAASIIADSVINNYEGDVDPDLSWYTVLKGFKTIKGSEGYLFYVGQGTDEEFAEYFRVVITYDGTIYLREQGSKNYIEYGSFPVG